MKNLILTAVLLLAASITFGQTLQKGNLVGVHVLTINLDPDVTMNQFKASFVDKWIPAAEKYFPGMKVFLLKGIKGENENRLGVLAFFESEEDRNKFWKEEGGTTELGTSASEKLNSVEKELEKLGTWSRKYTDWLIQ